MQVISRLFKQTNKSIGRSECDVPSVLIKLSLVSLAEPHCDLTGPQVSKYFQGQLVRPVSQPG